MTDISNASGKKKPTRFVTNVSPNNTSPTTPLSDITNVNASSSSNALKPSSHSTLQTISHKVHSPSSSNALKTPSSQTIQRNSHKENSFFVPPNCRVAQKFTELPPDFSNNQDTIQHNTTHSTTTKRKRFNTQDIPFFELNEDVVEPSVTHFSVGTSVNYKEKKKRGRPISTKKKTQICIPSTSNAQNDVTGNNHTKYIGISKDYLDSGDAVYVCSVCKAKVWQGEAIRGNKDLKKTCYSICCYNGKVELPSLIHPPQLLIDLYSGLSEKSQNFIQNIRRYNMMFAFTSMAGKIDHTVNSGGGPYVYRMHGQNYHIAGSLLPEEGESPRFCQLYIYDTDHEVQNRFKSCESNKKKKTTSNESMANPFSLEFWTIHELMGLLDFINPLVKQFRMARDRFGSNPTERIRLKLIGSRENDGRQYNLPTTNEVAALIIGDIDGQLKDEKTLGEVAGVVYTIEFQKRGLPHCHVCLFLEKNSKIPNPEDIDRVICAELPDKDSEPDLYQIVCDNMIHGPCGNDQPFMPCMKKGKCSKRFPREYTDHTYIDEDGYPIYRRRNDGNNVLKKGVSLDNRNVVPYNKILMKQYQAHMNLEWCNQVGSIKYLFKYINKGPDRITASIVDPTKKKKQQIENNDHDEIGEFYNCRYISACEACWRLFGYDIHYRTPPVERLSFHLEHKQPVVFKPNQHLNQVVSKPTVAASQFLAWMECNKHDEDARKLSYVEFPTKYVWNKSDKIWTKRKTKSKALGRLNHVSPKAGDIYYLRILLNKIKGPTCYEDIKKINGIVHDSYKDACYALGLLDDDREYISSINETHHWATASFCRSLFVMLITSDSLSSPAHVFEETYQCLSDDVIHVREQEIGVRGLKLKEDAIFNLTLSYIEKSLLSCGLSLKQIPNMPFPDHRYIQESCNMLIQDELNYDPGVIEVEHQDLYSKLNVEQKNVYHTIMNAVNNNQDKAKETWRH
ncbi:unnamed protein product [Lactuca virosa]|uniref:Helitron helicase-like domain-containing protein n=1 Tax=Lactuca virosa TaxID=75947 RepID=A0AAU9MVQ2_9ASTR|nr:unnamed protein product [Lactuca virosa]